MRNMRNLKKIKTGNVEVPIENFKDENITAHISIRLPLDLVNALRKLSLTEKYAGRYQVLIKDILAKHVHHNKRRAVRKE